MSSWLRCDCGHVLHTNLFAGAGVFLLILDEDFDRLTEPCDTTQIDHLFARGRPVYRCTQCGRLYVQWERGGKLTMYLPEPPGDTITPSA